MKILKIQPGFSTNHSNDAWVYLYVLVKQPIRGSKEIHKDYYDDRHRITELVAPEIENEGEFETADGRRIRLNVEIVYDFEDHLRIKEIDPAEIKDEDYFERDERRIKLDSNSRMLIKTGAHILVEIEGYTQDWELEDGNVDHALALALAGLQKYILRKNPAIMLAGVDVVRDARDEDLERDRKDVLQSIKKWLANVAKQGDEKSEKISIASDQEQVLRELEQLSKLGRIGEIIPCVSTIEWAKDVDGYRWSLALAESNNIIELKLDNCNLTDLPESFRHLQFLRKLNLYRNELRNLPESFVELKSLQFLDLGANALETLPESFGNLVSLQILSITNRFVEMKLENDQWTVWWYSIGSDTTEAKKIVNPPYLMELPANFGALHSLQQLDLSKNRLITLPESFSQLKSLLNLNLAQNLLGTLPESFGDLESLQTLDLSGNVFQTLPDSFLLLSNLKELKIINNLYPLDRRAKDILHRLEANKVQVTHWRNLASQVQLLLSQAQVQSRAGAYQDAIAYCEKALELDSGSAEAWRLMEAVRIKEHDAKEQVKKIKNGKKG